MQADMFSKSVQKYLRNSGHFQKELAAKLALHPKVLSRKLHNNDAYLTQIEVHKIIMALAEWHAIHTREEVHELLKAVGMDLSLFSHDEWQTPPLSTLIQARTRSTSSSSSSNSLKRKHNLPAPTTRLIGRKWVVERLQQLLGRDDVRLITLVGAGGSGKTRLALYLAHEAINTFAHGVWFVDLSGVNDPNLVSVSIAQTLQLQSPPDLPPLQSLISHLRKKQLLLVLDNFEQLGTATTTLASILAEAPRLKMLVTSRAVLSIYGEYEFSVPPLDVPDLRGIADTRVRQYGSVQLFVERAQAVQPDFTLTDENAGTIARICTLVDGLPLALELAAARVKALPLPSLVERLSGERLPLLTGGARNLPDRQQTLRNTITWSYNLLSPAEQVCFRNLGVFLGGWSLEAAESLLQDIPANEQDSSASRSPLDLLEHLMNQSLLISQPNTGKQVRFTMLATLREYALEQLTAQGELKQVRDRHTCYYLKEVEAAELGLRGPEQLLWLNRLVTDQDNIRSALEWSLQKAKNGLSIDASCKPGLPTGRREATANGHFPSLSTSDASLLALEVCLRMAAALRLYWEWQGNLAEGRHWLRVALEIPFEDQGQKTLLTARAKALSELSRLVFLQNNQEQAVELAEASIALWRQLNDPQGLAFALLHRGWAAHGMGDYLTAKRVYEEGLSSLSAETDPWLYAELLFHLAAILGFLSEYDLMHTYYAQSRELFERVGDKCACADLLKDHGGLLILEGSYTKAIDYLSQSIKLCYELNHKQFIATGIGWLSFAIGLRKFPDPAAASIYSAYLRGVSDNLMDEIGMNPWSRTLEVMQIVQQHIRSFVDEQTWENALAEGRALSLEQAIELVLQLREGV